jgi:hypothetical protein
VVRRIARLALGQTEGEASAEIHADDPGRGRAGELPQTITNDGSV